MPFDSDESDEIKGPNKKIGLKVSSSQPKKNTQIPNKEHFDAAADAQFSKIESYKQQMWDLSIKYKKFITDKTLPSNKGPIALDFEKEILEKLIKLASEMNEDATQEEGIGGIALCMLLMKCMLLQRDIINNLEFKLDQFIKNTAK